jgi:hypothetical protein
VSSRPLVQHVMYAGRESAIEHLLLSDELLRSHDPTSRRGYVELTENVEAAGGTVHVFSSLHASGEALMALGGVAAILRFPLPGLEEAIDNEHIAAEGTGASALAPSSLTLLETLPSGEVRLRDGAESVSTDASSEAGWAFEGEEVAAASSKAR